MSQTVCNLHKISRDTKRHLSDMITVVSDRVARSNNVQYSWNEILYLVRLTHLRDNSNKNAVQNYDDWFQI